MKKLLLFSSIILLLFTLTSCSYEGGSYKALSKVKSQVDKEYVSFGYNGIVINNKYNKITYSKIFDEKKARLEDIKQISDYAYLTGKSDNNLCFAKYNLKDDTYENYKIEFEIHYNAYSYILDDCFLVIQYFENKIDMLYYIDFDFNVTTQILTDDETISTSRIANNKYGVFAQYLKIYNDENRNERKLRNLWIYKDNNIYSVNINMDYRLSYFDEYIYDNYFVITTAGKQMIVFAYDLKTDEIIYGEYDKYKEYDKTEEYDKTYDPNSEIINYLYTKLNEDGYENYQDIPSMPDIEDVKNYTSVNKIIKKYNNNAKMGYSYEFDNNDGNLYYIVLTYVEITTIIPTDAGFSYTRELDPRYIFVYNEQEDKIYYLGYSMGSLLLLYVR